MIPDKIQLYLGDTRDLIASAIAVSKRSISSEVRHRVMMSFRMEELAKELDSLVAYRSRMPNEHFSERLEELLHKFRHATQSASDNGPS